MDETPQVQAEDVAEARRLASIQLPLGRGVDDPAAERPRGSAERRVHALEAELEALRQSTSWRLTAPIRALLDRVRGR